MKKLYFFLIMLSLCQIAVAQTENETYHRSGNPLDHPQNSTGHSGTGANIDVTYHRCDWTIDPTAAKNIAGTVTTYFKTTTSNVSTLTFDLNGNSFSNASLIVKYHGTTCTRTLPTSGSLLTITLPVTLGNNVFDSVSIAYSGAPPPVVSQAEGYQRKQDALNNWYIYTLSESYEDKDWWPCKADMQDKIDSMDINVTVPSAYWVAAPGKLIDSAINGANRTLKFKHRYPIASYLVALGVAKYVRFYRGVVNISGTNVPVVYNIFPDLTGSDLTTALNKLDVSMQELTLFSNRYGPYPFKDEKHGYYEFGWGGGMEHQSFSAMGESSLSSWSVIAHELAHQWFGDKVSFATWNHLWLAEGFAKYSEVLVAENLSASVGTTATTHITSIKNTARSTNNTPILLSAASIANSNTVWTTNNDNAIYQRGAMVVSMLRATLGDAKFFQACKDYMSDPLLAYKSATTADMERNMENQAGVDMSSFFQAWISGAGTPSYTGKYYFTGKTVQFKLTQAITGGASSPVSHFPMPVVIRIANSGNTIDTTVVIYHNTAGSLSKAGDGIILSGKDYVEYKLSFTPASVTFDPGNVTMATGTLSLSATVLADDASELKAQKITNGNQVDLSISNTTSAAKIELYKSSNGIDFTLAGEMANIGTTASRINFRYIDNNPFSPTTYYRASIVSPVRTTQSNIAKVQNVIVKKMTVSPSPASDVINVAFNNDKKLATTIKIIGVDGKKSYESTTTNNFIHFDVSSLPVGTYMVQIIQEGEISESARFLVGR